MSLRVFRWVLLALCAASVARAFPPAPTFILHGIARDAYGWALKSTDEAVVVVKRAGVVVAQGAVNEAPRAGENFRVAVPMDTEAGDPYRDEAQSSGNLLTFEVRFPTFTQPVLTIQADQRTVGAPGTMQFVDFTLGEDSDGDGIPDQWEWWQLVEAGFGPGDAQWSLGTFGPGDFDGDGVSDVAEYLAGTFAFLNGDTLALHIDGLTPGGEAILRTMEVEGKTYRVEWSEDLKHWTRAHVRHGSATADSQIHWTASGTGDVALYSPVSVGRPGLFYRLLLVR